MTAPEVRTCRFCGCTDADCSRCVNRTGSACWWVAEDVCSACQQLGATAIPHPRLPRSEWRRVEREHEHFRGCIHNMWPVDQIEARDKTVAWWMDVIGEMPAQITPADWTVAPPGFVEHVQASLADREALALLDASESLSHENGAKS